MGAVGDTNKGSALEALAKDLPKTNGDGGPNGNGGGFDVLKAVEGTSWETPGQAAYTFFSDTATSGTPSMLRAIVQSTLLDDVSHSDPTTNALEAYIASMFGFEAGLLVLSGTMGNQLAVRTHLLTPPASFVADARSHIITSEANGVAALSQAMPYTIKPANGRYVTLEEVRDAAVVSEGDDHLCPTRLVCLENTIGGAVVPLEECERIGAWARAEGIRMHLDGARIWEAVSAQVARGDHGGDFVAGLRAYGRCFDSVQTCFSKGLGAPIGSILLGSKELVHKARHFRKAMGGGIRAAGIIAGPARVAVDETFLGGKLAATHIMAKKVAEMWESRGGKLLQPVETNMVWIDLKAAGVSKEEWLAAGSAAGLRLGTSRIVCHYQLCEDAVIKLEALMDRFLGPATSNGA